jgi:sporulation protein YlmC with PRC-barrel domain
MTIKTQTHPASTVRRYVAATVMAPALGLGLLVALAPDVFAQAAPGNSTPPPATQQAPMDSVGPSVTTGATRGAAAGSPTPGPTAGEQLSRDYRASEMIGRDVRNPEGKDLGKIEDVIVNLKEGEIEYAVLSFGGFLGFGDKLFAFPTDTFTSTATSDELVLNIDEKQLSETPGFDNDEWPDWNAQGYRGEIDRHWEAQRRQAGTMDGAPLTSARGTGAAAPGATTPMAPGAGTTPQAGTGTATAPGTDAATGGTPAVKPAQTAYLVRASTLIDMDVKDSAGADVGEVEDLVINMADRTLRAVVLEFDRSWNMGDKLLALPPRAVQLPARGNDLVLAVDRDQVDPERAFDDDKWPDMNDPAYRDQTDRYFKSLPRAN